jgi:predicted PurR-regulated permease PerM
MGAGAADMAGGKTLPKNFGVRAAIASITCRLDGKIMNNITQKTVFISVAIVVGLYYFLLGLVEGYSFLMPITIAGLLAMLMLPVSSRLESWGINRGLSSLISTIVLLIVMFGFLFFLGRQVQSFAEDWPEIRSRVQPKIEDIQGYIGEKTGIPPRKQSEKIHLEENVAKIAITVPSFLSTVLLTLVYCFFFILYRNRFSQFILKMVHTENRDQAEEIIMSSSKVAQKYLLGRLILIFFLSLIYSIGLSIVGVKHAIFISILAAVLSLLPYVGNVVGLGVALSIGFFIGTGGGGTVLGILLVFGIAQFIESYILEPYVVGRQVNLNPIMTIIAIVLGGAVWGITGMVISIPAVGILKVICDHVPSLQPLGYLLGGEEETSSHLGKKLMRKIHSVFK